ncbi:MAG: aspartate/glutamate racemase family protein, partial [Rhodoferax sp.]|nr:aspartate/glutamate racemase family protein [Rhodoferax sp.]
MIGVFDSGLGGLSVLSAIARVLPRADLTYFADTAHLPYGNKPDEFIRGRVLAIGRHLVELGCNTIVVACNTATAAAVQALRTELH